MHPLWRLTQQILPFLIILFLPLLLIDRIVPAEQWLNTHMLYKSNQAYRYPYLMENFLGALRAGIWYPRWLPNLSGGYGNPMFIYYPAGYWYALLPLRLIVGNPLNAFYLFTFLMWVCGAAGMYRLTRLYSSPLAAAFCVVVFLNAAYLWQLLYVRGRHAELLSILLLPWCFYFFERLCEAVEKNAAFRLRAAAWAIAMAAVILVHTITGWWLLVASAALCAWRIAFSPQRHRLTAVLLACGICAIALSSPGWLPPIQLAEEVHGKRFSFAKFGWIGGRSMLLDYLGILPAMTGMAATIYAALAIRGSALRALLPLLMIAALAILFCTTGGGQWLWHHFFPLHHTQFPHRICALTAVFIPWAAAIAAGSAERRVHHPSVPGLVLLVAGIASTAQMLPAKKIRLFDYDAYASEVPNSWEDMTHGHAFDPLAERKRSLPLRLANNIPVLMAACDAGRVNITELPGSSPYHIHARVEITSSGKRKRRRAAPPCIVLNQWYLKGWQVRMNGSPVAIEPRPTSDTPSATLQKNGLIRIVPGGEGVYKLEAWYDGPPDWKLRNILIALALAATAVLIHLSPRIKRTNTT